MSSATSSERVERVVRRVEHVMGMPVSVALRGRLADGELAEASWAAVVDELRVVDRVFSTYREDSIVRRLDRAELALEDCPPEVSQVLALGRAAEARSGGAFSIWFPDGHGGRRLDPSGVVKGWAVQRASRFLEKLVDTDFCLSAGGDMVCRTTDPERGPWRIGVEDPADVSRVLAVIPVRNGAVATSGSAHRGSHLVDPRTGSAPEGVASVTVVADTLTEADVDATSAYVLGREADSWLRTRPIRSALIVWADQTTSTVAPG